MEDLTLGVVSLRKLQPSDNIAIAALANNRKVWDNLTDLMPHPYAVADADVFINIALTSEDQRIFAITYKEKLAGVIGLHRQKDVYRLTAEIGYWLGEPYWNMGIATRAAKLATYHGITRMGLLRIYACTYDFNKASQRVLEKAGYIFECVTRKSVIKNGVVLDAHMYSFIDDYLTEDYLTEKHKR